MNFLLGRKADAAWQKSGKDWRRRLAELHALIIPIYQEKGLPIPDYQDLQNQLCEFHKYWSIKTGLKTRLKREYKPAEPPKPPPIKKLKSVKPEIIASTTPAVISSIATKPTTTVSIAPKPESRRKPQTYQINFAIEALPPALIPLTTQPRWVCWRWEWRNGKWTKPPIQPGNRYPAYAKSNDPTTWGTFAEAVHRVTAGMVDGISFCLLGSNIAAVDLDHCRNRATGTIADWAQDIVRRAPAGAYCEVTVSGEGLRLIGRGAGYEIHRKFPAPNGKGAFELYRNTARCITVSGKVLDA
jgi:hypothetical protein